MRQARRIVGSGAGLTRGRLWPQIVADVLGREVYVAADAGGGAVEATTLGALLLCIRQQQRQQQRQQHRPLLLVSAAPSLGSAAVATFVPDKDAAVHYQRAFERHTLLYDALAPVHAKLLALN